MFQKNQQIGIYTLIEKIGRGGFGEVWLAERRSELVTKRVAVKLPHDEQVKIEAIKQEAELWEQASGHANVLPIIDADIYDGQIVIVSEYAEGGSLHDRISSKGKFPVEKACEMSIGILSGLEFLHNRRIIHRDIKPQNILLQGETPRLADFGISRAMQTTAVSSKIVGTDAYMAPESFSGQRSVQTDVWSVGIVLYLLLKGSLPFPQEHPAERMFAILQQDFEPLPNDIPKRLKEIVGKSLAKLPEDRYQSAALMREDLQNYLYGKTTPEEYKSEVTRIASNDLPPQTNPPQMVIPTSKYPETKASVPTPSPTKQSYEETVASGNQKSESANIIIPINTSEPQAATQNIQPVRQTEFAETSGGGKTLLVGLVLAGILLSGLLIGVVGVALISNTSNGESAGLIGGNENDNESSSSKSDPDSSKTDGDKSDDPNTTKNDLTKDKETSILPENDPIKDSSTPETPKETPTPTKTPTPKPTREISQTVGLSISFEETYLRGIGKAQGVSVRISSKGKTYSARSNGSGVASFGKIPCGQRVTMNASHDGRRKSVSRTVKCGKRQSWGYNFDYDGEFVQLY